VSVFFRPDNTRAIAASVGGKMAAAIPSNTCATVITTKLGTSVTRKTLTEITAVVPMSQARLRRVASMIAPAGVCATSPAMPPMVRATPMLAAFQSRLVSK